MARPYRLQKGFDMIISKPQAPLLNSSSRKSLRSSFSAFATVILLCFLVVLPYVKPAWRPPTSSKIQPTKETHSFQWSRIVPSKQLRYTNCYGSFQCARLDVPLNWNASFKDGGPRAAIAIIKLPAKVPVTDERYGGAVILNPGGPGESGVHQILSSGHFVQTILDAPSLPSLEKGDISDSRYFDIISFDPRGVNNTTPRLKCFADAFKQQAWLLERLDYGILWDSESSLGLEWARAHALGASCSQEISDQGMVRYVNTAQVVQDMVEIIERHAEWRQTEAKSIVALDSSLDMIEKQHIFERAEWMKGQEKLLYWGVSYGTLLGQTFAAMHPDRVGRLAIDGVMDAEDYYHAKWVSNLHDSDKIVTKLCEYCFEAGPEKCPLYTGNSGRDIEERYEQIIFDLKKNPVPVLAEAAGYGAAEVITFGDISLRSLTAMTFPYASAEGFFRLLAEIADGNFTAVANGKQGRLNAAMISAECLKSGSFSDACLSDNYISLLGTTQMIGCMDSSHTRDKTLTKESFTEYFKELQEQSKWFSTSWARNKIACVGVKVDSAWIFEGPIEGETAHPILMIGNSHDTVTPLRNARRASTKFKNSVVLQQNSEGHCSYSNPSLCTARILRSYFQTGQLPGVGTVCEPEYNPFIGCLDVDENMKCRERDEDQERTWRALVGMTDFWA